MPSWQFGAFASDMRCSMNDSRMVQDIAKPTVPTEAGRRINLGPLIKFIAWNVGRTAKSSVLEEAV